MWHAPFQIELGFAEEAKRGYYGDDAAKIILAGRYGYRKGLKKVRAPPDTRHNLDHLHVSEGGDTCATPERVRKTLDAYQTGAEYLEDLPDLD